MKTPLITTKDVIRGKKTITVPATYTEEALNELREFHRQGLKNGAWDLDEPHFIGLVSASGVVGLTLGNKKENEKDLKIMWLEDELRKLQKAEK